MKKLILLALVSTQAFAQEVPSSTMSKLKKLYPDQSEAFLQERIKNAPGLFDKWRSFPPYYWDMMKGMKKANQRQGLCAGDPHIENFGFVADAAAPIFTINDLDDVTPCSLDMDLMRFFIGSRMLLPTLDAKSFLDTYTAAQKGGACEQPAFIKSLHKDAVKKAQGLSKKNKAMLETKTCEGEYAVLTPEEKAMLDDFTKAQNGDKSCSKSEVLSEELVDLSQSITNTDKKEIVHACSRTKDSGGSAGGKRFVVFTKSASGKTEAYELKPLLKPAPSYYANSKLPREALYKKSVETFLGSSLKDHYYPVTLNKVLYQRRPLWGGNEGVKLEDLAASEYENVLKFETCTLAKAHSKSNSAPLKTDAKAWDELAKKIEAQFKADFGGK